jgi:hypothetical protein
MPAEQRRDSDLKKKLLFCLFFPLWPCGLCVYYTIHISFLPSIASVYACMHLSIHPHVCVSLCIIQCIERLWHHRIHATLFAGFALHTAGSHDPR